MSEEFWPVLIVDDEYSNVSALEELIERAVFNAFPNAEEPIKYTESVEEAMELMIDSMKNNERFSAIISDNHMSGISGDDYLRIIRGQAGYCFSKDERFLRLDLSTFNTFEDVAKKTEMRSKEILEFLKNSFKSPQYYRAFVQYYFGDIYKSPIITLLCGHPREADLTGLEDNIYVVQKCIQSFEAGPCYCEQKVMEYLKNEGLFLEEHAEKAINKHPRFAPQTPFIKRRYNPSSHHVKKKTQLLKLKKSD